MKSSKIVSFFVILTFLLASLPVQAVHATGEATANSQVGTWTFCANEGGTCSFTGTKLVRYGSGGTYSAITGPFTNSVACNNGVFGDPTPGVVKTCEYSDPPPPVLNSFTRQNPATSPTNADTLIFRATFNEVVQEVDATDFTVNSTSTATITNLSGFGDIWTFCANEGGTCNFTGTKQVRYGSGGTYSANTGPFTNGVACNNGVFGDPTPGVVKTCEYLGFSTYDITVSGGDLASFNGTVGLNLAGGQNIQNLSGTALPAGEPATDETYLLDNAGPIVVTTSLVATYTTGPSGFTVTFSEDVNNAGGGAGADDVENPANYLLVEDGANGAFDTVSCGPVPGVGGLQPDDTQVTVDSVAYNGGLFTATLGINGGTALPDGNYRLFVCGTTSIVDLVIGNPLNGGADYTFDFTVQAAGGGGGGRGGAARGADPTTLPATGFPMGRVTKLPVQPAEKAYTSTDLVLEIPSMDQKLTIVGVPQSDGSWDVTWLGDNAGYLAGSAFPTWSGNTVITGHVWDAWNQPGPFAELKTLKYGDQFYIHAWGMTYTYEVRQNRLLFPSRVNAAFEHEEYDWVTLMTCEYYNPFKADYLFRRMVRAVLVSVK